MPRRERVDKLRNPGRVSRDGASLATSGGTCYPARMFIPSEASPRIEALARVQPMGESAVRFQGVSKAFAGRDAVAHLDLDVRGGAIYGLLGPNGAGKTTSIRMLMGILGPDTGRIEVLGSEPNADVKDRIGYLPEERGLYVGMR